VNDFVAELAKYDAIVADLLHDAPPLEFARGTAMAVQVERGAALFRDAADTAAADRLIELSARPELLEGVAVIDAAGHARPVYRPLLIYAWLMAYRQAYESLPPATFGRWDEALRPWCDLLEAELGRIGVSDTGTPAMRGGSAAEAAWTALALHVAGTIFVRDAWTDLAADTFGRLTRGQQPDGSFLIAASSVNPEPRWYHELAILHAAASYAVRTEDRALARAVARSSMFIQNEIEPDHATGQPWALFAFVWNATTRPLADQLLHAVRLRKPGVDGVSLILLADALYSLRLFTDPQPQKS
jgi:hypothetical protein